MTLFGNKVIADGLLKDEVTLGWEGPDALWLGSSQEVKTQAQKYLTTMGILIKTEDAVFSVRARKDLQTRGSVAEDRRLENMTDWSRVPGSWPACGGAACLREWWSEHYCEGVRDGAKPRLSKRERAGDRGPRTVIRRPQRTDFGRPQWLLQPQACAFLLHGLRCTHSLGLAFLICTTVMSSFWKYSCMKWELRRKPGCVTI